jgi:hypothetical protein
LVQLRYKSGGSHDRRLRSEPEAVLKLVSLGDADAFRHLAFECHQLHPQANLFAGPIIGAVTNELCHNVGVGLLATNGLIASLKCTTGLFRLSPSLTNSSNVTLATVAVTRLPFRSEADKYLLGYSSDTFGIGGSPFDAVTVQ